MQEAGALVTESSGLDIRRQSGTHMKRKTIKSRHRWASFLSLSLCGSMSVYAQVVPVNGSSVSNVGSATQIDIVKPDAHGTSYNSFSEFETLGVVINNSRTNTASKLVGGVKRNPALAGGTASTIVLDNIGDAPMRLNGLVEIAGDRADLLMVGRNGIVCNSCGFINTGNLTLGAGELRRDADGKLRLDTSGARINIGGAGLSAPEANVALVAQQIDLLAPIYGKDVALHIVKGLYGVEDGRTESLGEAFDAELGDYVGVPNILADGSITLYTNARRLDVKNVNLSATGDIKLQSEQGEIDVESSRFKANENLAMQAQTLDIRKSATDSRNLSLQGEAVKSYGMFSVADEIKVAAGQAKLEASSFDSRQGTALSVDQLELASVRVNGSLAMTADVLKARSFDAQGEQARIEARDIQMEGGELAYRKLAIEGFEQLSTDGSRLRADALAMSAAGADATVRLGGGTRVTSDSLALEGIASLENAGDITLRGGLTLAHMDQVTNRGRIHAASLEITGVRGAVRNAGDITVADSRLSGVGAVDNAGRWTSESFAMADSGSLDNTGDLLAGELSVANSEGLANSGRLTAADARLTDVRTVSNRVGGEFLVTETLETGAVGQLENAGRLAVGTLAGSVSRTVNSGDLAIRKAGRLQGDSFVSTGRLLVSDDGLSLAQGTVTLSGALQGSRIAVAADTVTLRQIDAGLESADIEARDLISMENARLAAATRLKAARVETSEGTVLSGDLTVAAGSQRYRDTEILGSRVVMSGEADSGEIHVENVRLKAQEHLDIGVTQSLELKAAQFSGGELSIASVGSLRASDDVTLEFARANLSQIAVLDNAGNIGADALALADIGSLVNTGKLVAAREGRIDRVSTLDNTGEVSLASAAGEGNGDLENRGKLGIGTGTLAFAQWQNHGDIKVGTAMLTYEDFVNAGGTVAAAEDLTLAGEQLQNEGVLTARRDLSLLGPDIRNAGRIESGRDLALGRAAGEAGDVAHRFVNVAGAGSVTAGRDLLSRVDNFVSKASYHTVSQTTNSTEYASSGTYGTCQGSGHGSCRGNFNAAGGAQVVWYGSGGFIPVYGVAGRNGATVITTTQRIEEGSYRDAPIRVGRNLVAAASGTGSVFDTHAATLEVGGSASFNGIEHRDTSAFEATDRVQKRYFTDVYRCWSDVACVNSGGNNTFHAREGSYDGRSPTDVTETVSRTGGLQEDVALSSVPAPEVDLPAPRVMAALEPSALPPFPDIGGIVEGRRAAPADPGLPRPTDEVIVTPVDPQSPLRIAASDFLFPAIPGELPESEKRPEISDDDERGFDRMNSVRTREDQLGRSCHEVAQSNDATTLDSSQPRPECRIELHYPEPRDS
ncbi:filamentous hemagglutinin N-terminal domain-containing protein [Bordetella hinzii]|uniref:two-partner secretion domain-containing protein n=1 Tax=Bordetella hinzii TaxID=103855 RepID=UPI0039FBE591